MGAELTREERDAFERLQVEVVELRRLLGELPPELAREEAAAQKAEALRDELLAAVKARDEGLKEPRDRVRWLEKDAGKERRLELNQAISLVAVIFKVGLVGIGGGILLCLAFLRLIGGGH